MQKISKNKGITLVSLIVTIIILMILAGVITITVTGNNGILGKTKLARETYQNSASEENNSLSNYENEIDKASIDVTSSRDENDAKHERLSSPLFYITYSSGSGTTKGTYNIKNFSSIISKSANFDNYFTINSNYDLVCNKEGYYILNLSCRGSKNGADGSLNGGIIVNEIDMGWVDSYQNSNNTEIQTGNMVNVYLMKNDTVNFRINSPGMAWTSLLFYIYAN